jgi:hypothetical protein
LVHAETWRRGGRKFVDDTVKTLLERCSPKVDEESDGQIHEPKIGKQLFTVDRCKVFHRFELDNHPAFDEEVSAKSFLKNHPVVFKANGLLPFN